MMGRPPLDAAQVLVDELQIPMTAKEFHAELYGELMNMFPDAKLLPGKASIISRHNSYSSSLAKATALDSQHRCITSSFSVCRCCGSKGVALAKLL